MPDPVGVDRIQLAHDIPGRLRLRLPREGGDTDIAGVLAQEAGVARVTWSPRTRSLLILYDAAVVDRVSLIRRVARHTGFDAPEELDTTVAPVVTNGDTLVSGVIAAFNEVDDRVRRATRGLTGLSGVVPLALVGWALREAVRGNVAALSWSSALWYAHGLFRDYSAVPRPPALGSRD